jgi:hypothetical protein
VVDKARAAFMTNRMIYSFTIPPNVTGADLIVDAWNSTAVGVAGDEGGGPGEFREELNALTLFGRQDYENQIGQDFALDLTPYLKDNSTRTVYVAIYAADTTTGWTGAAWSRVEVAVLDEGERARLARIQRRVDGSVQDYRAHCLLDIRTNRKDAEAPYLYQDRGSEVMPYGRFVNGAAEVIYRFPMKPEYRGAKLMVWLLGDSLVSYATNSQGKPGAFTTVLRARDKFDQQTIETYMDRAHAEIDITQPMIDSGAIYIKVRDGDPDKAGGTQIHTLRIVRP